MGKITTFGFTTLLAVMFVVVALLCGTGIAADEATSGDTTAVYSKVTIGILIDAPANIENWELSPIMLNEKTGTLNVKCNNPMGWNIKVEDRNPGDHTGHMIHDSDEWLYHSLVLSSDNYEVDLETGGVIASADKWVEEDNGVNVGILFKQQGSVADDPNTEYKLEMTFTGTASY